MEILRAGIYALSNLTNLSGYAYVTGLLDIGIISSLIYTAIILFRRARSYVVMVGIALLGVLYGIALVLELYLTTLVLQAFFAVILIIVVVLFQEELRRFFERVATVGTRITEVTQHKEKQKRVVEGGLVEEISRAVASLAQRKVGALLIFPGEENVERHVSGGQMLDAVISEDLLLSVFDPNSPAHDGAVLVDQQRLVRFGLHLPLSQQLDRVAKMGTRHTAALGLSERCDALVLVVSEEKGTISIARNGDLRRIQPDTIAEELSGFFTQQAEREEHLNRSMLLRNLPQKLISIGLAAFLWFLVAFPAGTVQRDFVERVSYQNLADEVVVLDTDPVEVAVTLSARGRAPFESVQPENIQLVIDGAGLQDGLNVIRLEEGMVRRPTNISVVNLEPDTIEVLAERVRRVDVPIEPEISGTPAEGFVVDRVFTTPRTLPLLIPSGAEVPESLSTEQVFVDGIDKNRTISVLVTPPPRTRLADPEQARVSVTIEVREAEPVEE